MVVIDCKSPLTKSILEYQKSKFSKDIENIGKQFLITDNPDIVFTNDREVVNISKLSPPFDIKQILSIDNNNEVAQIDEIQELLEYIEEDIEDKTEEVKVAKDKTVNSCCEELEIIKTKIFEVIKKHHTQMVSELEILLDRGNEKR